MLFSERTKKIYQLPLPSTEEKCYKTKKAAMRKLNLRSSIKSYRTLALN